MRLSVLSMVNRSTKKWKKKQNQPHIDKPDTNPLDFSSCANFALFSLLLLLLFSFALHFQFYFMSIEFNFNRNNVLSWHLPISMNHSLLLFVHELHVQWWTQSIVEAPYATILLCFSCCFMVSIDFLVNKPLRWPQLMLFRILWPNISVQLCIENYFGWVFAWTSACIRLYVTQIFTHKLKMHTNETAISNNTHMDTILNWRLLLCMKFQSHLK